MILIILRKLKNKLARMMPVFRNKNKDAAASIRNQRSYAIVGDLD
jgi:hypothetical protein